MSPPTQSSGTGGLKETLDGFSSKALEDELDKLRTAVQDGNPQQVIMALPMLLALTVCPAMLGTQEAIRQSQSKTKREEHRARRCNLIVSCVKPSIRSRDINNKLVVLRDQKLYIANELTYEQDEYPTSLPGYPFSGYFLPYPDSEYEGLVSTISDDPPFLNWIYVDRDTYEVKYGVRAYAQDHLTGPFDCTPQDRRMTIEGWEGFVAVEEVPGLWALYYDRDDDGLKSKVSMGTRVLEVELIRREKKERKPEPDPDQPTTLDEKMRQHKAQTQQEENDKEEFLASQTLHIGTQSASKEGHSAQDFVHGLSDEMHRLKAAIESLAESSRHEGGHHSAPPSVVTNGFESSAPRYEAGSEPVTAASSVFECNQSSQSHSTGSEYKAPFVEDVD